MLFQKCWLAFFCSSHLTCSMTGENVPYRSVVKVRIRPTAVSSDAVKNLYWLIFFGAGLTDSDV